MPKPDGTLYWYERERLSEKAEPKKAKPAAKAVKKAKPVGVAKEQEQAAYHAPVIHPTEFGKPVGKAGRKPGSGRLKATPEVIQKILANISRGLTQEKALILAGISRQAMHRWKKANPVLQQKFDEAEAEAEAKLVDTIVTATSTDWKAANWLLERRHAWAAVTKTELTGKNGGPVQSLSIAKQLVGSMSTKADPAAKRVQPVELTA